MVRRLPYPPALRSGRLFNDPREMLRWALDALARPSRQELRLVTVSPQDLLVVDVALPLLRSAAACAEGILAISRRPILETTIPILRTMLETWAEFNLLLSPGDRSERAAIMKIWAAFAIAESHKPIPAQAQRQLHRLRTALPAETQTVEKRRGKNKVGHWSGKSRKGLIGEYCGDEYARMYELLSWDAHPVVQVLLDIRAAPEADQGRRIFVHRTPQEQLLLDILPTATHILVMMWNSFAAHVDSLTLPSSKCAT